MLYSEREHERHERQFIKTLSLFSSRKSRAPVDMSAEEVLARYEQQGYLSALPILSPEELQSARDAFAELERKHGECRIHLHDY